ncbi:MAG: hypothetical protein HUJ69_04580 [Lachnospiraceae bacterium]|nr:hypothetical protein [Lachnospiraceae bacterium]
METKGPSKERKAVRDIALMGAMLALLFAGKRALDMLPNVELVTLFFMLFARHFGKKTYPVCLGFTALEALLFGLQVWVVMYLYMWPLLVTLVLILNRKEIPLWGYSILSALFGLFFGAFCAIPYLFIGGFSMALAWWISGIPYDLVHCVANLVIALVLFPPLDKALFRIRETLELG